MPIARCELEGAKAQRRRYGPTLVLLVIAAIWLLAASRWIATDTIVPWDAKNQFYAFFRFLATAIHSGQAPFWNPYHYGGHPSVADPQSLIFSPPFVLWALFDPAPSIRAFDLIVYAHLAAGGLAVGVLGWRAGWPAAASILAAVIFMLGGPASGRLQHTGIILSYGLFPVALLLLQLAVRGSLVTMQVDCGPYFDTLPEVGGTDRSFNYLVVGAASTVVMLWFGIAGGWMARRGTRLMTAVLAVALLYALGRYTPVYALAFEYVPGVHLFRRPIDGTFVLVAAFALIAGQLLADYVREGTPRVARWRVASVGLCALGVVGWAVAFSEKTHH